MFGMGYMCIAEVLLRSENTVDAYICIVFLPHTGSTLELWKLQLTTSYKLIRKEVQN